MGYEEIITIQFKRGKKDILEARLIESDLGVPAASEPIHEYDTGKLKFGDGVTAYKDLPYFGGGSSGGEDPRFIIQDPLNGQVLLYDSESKKWVNKDLADEESIIYLTDKGLTIQGFKDAAYGQMLVKDKDNHIAWIDQPSIPNVSEMNSLVAAASSSASQAANAASKAETAQAKAEIAQGQADLINQKTMNWVNGKFWWGTASEYNEEIAENGLQHGCFYFVRPE